MTGPGLEITKLAERLRTEPDFKAGGGLVDVEFWALRLNVSPGVLGEVLAALAAEGGLSVSEGWRCPACSAVSTVGLDPCPDCGRARDSTEVLELLYSRPAVASRRDPAALFLIHGMNTLGAWQESLSWKIQLLYGYSVPVFVFKYGWDLVSPWRVRAQRRRTDQLAAAIRKAQVELAGSGRSERCDVVAHSFGTLLIAALLAEPKHRELVLGKVILTGSIIARDYPWDRILEEGRVEAVLNHRAGKDIWVRLAPWGFPRTGATGFLGFQDAAAVEDLHAPTFTHSDYFTSTHFDQVVQDRWKPFLGTQSPAPPKGSGESQFPTFGMSRRFWVGRLALGVVIILLCWVLLRALVLAGMGAEWVLGRLPG